MTPDTGLLPADRTAASAIDPFSDDYLHDPYPFHERLREAGPVVRLAAWDVWCVARHADVRAVLGDWRSFANGAGVGLANFHREPPWRTPSFLLEADPPVHTARRAVMARVMSPANLRRLRVALEARVETVVDQLLGRPTVDALPDIAEAYILSAFPDAVGISAPDRHHLMAYGDMVFNSFGPRNDRFRRSARDQDTVVEWVMHNCRRESLGEHGLGREIFAAADQGEITEQEALFLVRSFLSAGVDTTVYAIGNLLHALATHPAQWEALRADPSRARMAIEEALRWEAPLQAFFRTTTAPTAIGDVTLEAEEKVLVLIGAANRDPRRWEQPSVFDIQRQSAGQLGFGAGIHGCVGQVLSRLEMEVLLRCLVTRIRRIELADEPRRVIHNVLRGLSSLPLRLVAA